MRNLKKTTEQKREYLIDMKVTKGLYATAYEKKVKNNCEFYGIEIPISEPMNHISSKISKRGTIVILTICFLSNHYIQFKIKNNLNIKELNKLSRDLISDDIKLMILKAYDFTKMRTIRELISY